MKLTALLSIPCAALLTTGLLQAQSSDSSAERSGTFSTIFEGGYTSGGDLEHRDANTGGEVETTHFRWNGTYEQPVGEAWSFQIGADYDYLKLDYDGPASLLPDSLTGVALELGARWRFSDTWAFGASIAPGLYGDDEVDSSDAFTVPAMFTATWIYSDRLSVTLGLRVNPFSDSEIMPVAQVRWDINPEWTLVLGMPRTEARYRVNKRLTVFGGVGMLGGSYAVDDPSTVAPLGKSLRDTKVSVSEFRGVIGIDYAFTPDTKLSLEGGYAFSREIDYHERGVKYEADAAPTLGLSLNISF